jgi:hypothetical protein
MRGGGEMVQITGVQGPIVVQMYLSRKYHYQSTAQINPFRPSPSYSAAESHYFQFSVNIFGRSALAGSTKNFFFTEPTLDGPDSKFQTVQTYFWITKTNILLRY